VSDVTWYLYFPHDKEYEMAGKVAGKPEVVSQKSLTS
jgi:hypothetical protein